MRFPNGGPAATLILFYSSERPAVLPAWRLVLEMNLNERLWIMGFIKGLS
jgi:hypothetical protein